MNHRHLEVAPGTPPEAQPLAAIVDILQRGDLDDWRPIARAIRRDPMGEFADKVLRLLDAYPMYGTSSLWRSWIECVAGPAPGCQATRHPQITRAIKSPGRIPVVGSPETRKIPTPVWSSAKDSQTNWRRH